MSKTIFDRESESIFQTYKRLHISADRAEGCRIFASDGGVYLDFLGGIAVNSLGHSHPAIIKAAKGQIDKYMHLSNFFYQEPQVRLAEKLKGISGYERVFFSNSGAESIEGAIKLARLWGRTHNKSEIIAFTGGFHGRTYGALSIMDKPLFKDGMGPFLPGTKVIKYNDADELNANVDENTSAIIMEFIQGEGGLAVADEKFIEAIIRLKEEYGFLLIADEIQSGAGRTGRFFAFGHFGIRPDVVTMAKGIGGGLPLGAILATDKVANLLEPGMHGTTYGGNAVACATGLAVLEELENGLMDHVNEVSAYLNGKLNEIKNDHSDKVLEVRGMGLMTGLLLSFDSTILRDELLKRKIITNAGAGNILRLLPPLIINNSDIDEFIDGLGESLAAI